jgi:hypothetical protein
MAETENEATVTPDAQRQRNQSGVSARRNRQEAPFCVSAVSSNTPVIPFEQAMRFGQDVAEVGAGHPVNRKTLFEAKKLLEPGACYKRTMARNGRV